MSEFECKVCRLPLNSQEQLTQHLSGKSHRKKMKALGYMEAGLNESIEPPPVMQSDPLNLQQSVPQAINTAAPKKRKSSDDMEPGICPLCNVIFNSQQQKEQHFSGSKHIKRKKMITGELKIESQSKSGELYCRYCMIQVNSPEQMEIHLQGKKHRESFEQMTTFPVSFSQPNHNVVEQLNTFPISSSQPNHNFVVAETLNTEAANANTSQTDEEDFPGSWKNKYEPKTTEINMHFDQTGMLYCGFCNIHVNSMEQLEIHRQGAKHKRKFAKVTAAPVKHPSMRPPEKQPFDAPTELPPFESYLTTFVMSSTTESTVQSSQGLN